MASISREANRRWRVLFVDVDRKRRTLRLGTVSREQAEQVKIHVAHLVESKFRGCALPSETARWLASVGEELAGRLLAVGLVATGQVHAETPGRHELLDDFLEGYISSRIDVKASTKRVYAHTRRNLVNFFGAGKPLALISPGDADLWRLNLVGQGLADNTVRRRSGIAKQFFRTALRRRLIAENPFADLKCAIQANRKRDHFVTREDASKILDACPDAEWRLLFALARFGGLRIPSEVVGLCWGDVNWDGGWFMVRSPKTEHHSGGDCRRVPLFPELRPHLEQVFEQAEPGTECIIRRRDGKLDLRTNLLRIITRAGLKPWPKLFQNLRATRETELAETYPIHKVVAWLGHSEAVANKHYLQVTDDDFLAAALDAPGTVAGTVGLARARTGSQTGGSTVGGRTRGKRRRRAEVQSVPRLATPCTTMPVNPSDSPSTGVITPMGHSGLVGAARQGADWAGRQLTARANAIGAAAPTLPPGVIAHRRCALEPAPMHAESWAGYLTFLPRPV